MNEKILKLNDGHNLFYRVWECEKPIATFHINHGMAEHSRRYDDFASYLNSLGFVVYCQDHRGHGFTKDDDEKGWFADSDGWNLICDDSWELDKLISNDYSMIPHFLFGHSMGSFVARTNMALHSHAYSGAIICGTGADLGLVGKIGKKIALMHVRKYGSRMPDQDMDRLAFGSYCKKFPGEGEYAWLSSDRTEVQKYIDDPLCGFVCSSQFYVDLFDGMAFANDEKKAAKIRKNLPVLIISGALDPVGNYSNGVKKVYKLYQKAGLTDVRLKLIEKGRHEILNDTCREEAQHAISDFCLEIANR